MFLLRPKQAPLPLTVKITKNFRFSSPLAALFIFKKKLAGGRLLFRTTWRTRQSRQGPHRERRMIGPDPKPVVLFLRSRFWLHGSHLLATCRLPLAHSFVSCRTLATIFFLWPCFFFSLFLTKHCYTSCVHRRIIKPSKYSCPGFEFL